MPLLKAASSEDRLHPLSDSDWPAVPLSLQVLAAWQLPSSQAVALTYVVRNGSESLNGTISSGLLGQLSAELVGYFLFYPPLSIAERGCPRGSSHTCRFLSDAASRFRPDPGLASCSRSLRI